MEVGPGNGTASVFAKRYVDALYRAGRLPFAYTRVGPRKQTFEQLVRLLIMDSKGAELERLVAAHRSGGGDEADLLFHEFRARIP